MTRYQRRRKKLQAALQIRVYTKHGPKTLYEIVKRWQNLEEQHVKICEAVLLGGKK